MLRTEINETDEIHIKDDKFQSLINNDLKTIIEALQDNGFEVRIVGGAVRDLLLGLKPRDIDLLTNAQPDEIIYILSDLDIEADSWGIKHGTIKAVVGREKYEITSLNFQINKKGGKIEINSHGTWEDDAARRDFSVNALSMTLDGRVYDYVGGLADLEREVIRPLGDFGDKVIDDAILILRFFKMISKFSKPRFSKHIPDIVKSHIDLLDKVEAKRLRKELGNIKKGPNAKQALELMRKLGVLGKVQELVKPKHL